MKINYLDNDDWIPDDWVKAVECFQKAATEGNAKAQHRLWYADCTQADLEGQGRKVMMKVVPEKD